MNDEAWDVATARLSNHRELAKIQRDKGEFEEALATLERAVNTGYDFAPIDLLISLGNPDDSVKRFAFTLADCLGMAGGLLRRLGRPGEAAGRFGEGRTLEIHSSLEVASSYNSVNFIKIQLEAGGRTTDDLAAEISEARALLEEQVRGTRRRDRWAWADLGDCRLLAGDLDSGIESYVRFRQLARSEPEQFSSALRVLSGLAAQLAERADRRAGVFAIAHDRLTSIAV